jgi:hypothetical protein
MNSGKRPVLLLRLFVSYWVSRRRGRSQWLVDTDRECFVKAADCARHYVVNEQFWSEISRWPAQDRCAFTVIYKVHSNEWMTSLVKLRSNILNPRGHHRAQTSIHRARSSVLGPRHHLGSAAVGVVHSSSSFFLLLVLLGVADLRGSRDLQTNRGIRIRKAATTAAVP